MRFTITWLSYLTNENFQRRHERHEFAFKSFLPIMCQNDIDVVLVDNSEEDNHKLLKMRDAIAPNIPIFKAKNEWMDVAAHYVAALRKSDYFAYAYDDFVFYDPSFITDSISYMDKKQHIACIRLPEYDVDNISKYDSSITPKSINPDSVSHTNSPKNQRVFHKNEFKVGDHIFFESNWRPISRPTLWRTESWNEIIGYPKKCHTMQQFEAYMYDRVDQLDDWRSGFIDQGVCKTYPESTSERLRAKMNLKSTPIVDIEYLRSELTCQKRWL